VIYDKAADYVSYYLYCTEENDSTSGRIYPEATYIESYKGCISEPTLIVDNIYLGSAYNAASYDTLKKHDINVIFNVTTEIRNYFPADFVYYQYKLYDNNKHSIAQYLDDSFEKIRYHQDNTPGNILVHCFMGASRSVSIVINYIMHTMVTKGGEYYTFDQALQYIKNKRPIINPTQKLFDDIVSHNMHHVDE
jgi:protein-tyrosine phosphatase